MFGQKYIIIVIIIIIMLLLYYFYYEISKIKKSIVPIYQKTMALDSKIIELENRKISPQKISTKKNVSPVYSISYQSDMVKNGTNSIKYTDISESDAKKIAREISQTKKTKTHTVPRGEISDLDKKSKNSLEKRSENLFPDGKILSYHSKSPDTDTVKLKFSELLKPQDVQIINLETNKTNTAEYKKILDNLSVDVFESDNITDELDHDIIRNISESIKCAPLSSEKVSDISN